MERIVVVSGLPRSGTSLMMQMLEAGGIPPLTDHERAADEDNPKGYFELERAKKMPDGDTAWLSDAQGKAVKVITALLSSLPSGYEYDVIMMRREMAEILASQQQMLVRRGVTDNKISDELMALSFQTHLEAVSRWLAGQQNLRSIDVKYSGLVLDTHVQARRVADFLERPMDLQAMVNVVSPDLYRQRNQ